VSVGVIGHQANSGAVPIECALIAFVVFQRESGFEIEDVASRVQPAGGARRKPHPAALRIVFVPI
jgi:hypothetical protein